MQIPDYSINQLNTNFMTIRVILKNMMEEETIKAFEQEQRNIRVCAVEDCMKVKRLLAGWGIQEHLSVLSNPANWFDYFYELEIEQLHREKESMEAEASERIQKMHNLGYIGKYD